MRRTCLFVVLWALGASHALAQVERNTPVTLRGQVFTPQGAPLQKNIRLLFQSDNGMRNDQLFTDSNGRFAVMGVFPNETYILTVESDGENWGTTVVRFIPSGRHPTVSIDLLPPEKKFTPPGDRVSVAGLRQDVPRDARKEYQAALQRIALGEHVEARPLLERAIELYPDFVEARNELAVALMKVGQLDAAEAQLRRALEIDSTAVRPLLNLGLCLYRQQRYADARPFLEKATQLDPSSARGQLLLGITLVMNGEDNRAEAVLRRAYAQGGMQVARAQFYLAHIYVRRKDYSRAAKVLETYLRDVPGDPHAAELQQTLEKLRASLPPNENPR